MGLPDPDEVVAEDAAAKLDRAAAHRRSNIRREPSIRPGRDQSSAAGLTNIIRTRHQRMLTDRLRLQREQVEADFQIAQLEEELEALRRIRLRTQARNRAILSRDAERSRAGRDEVSPRDTTAPRDVELIPNENQPVRRDDVDDVVILPRPSRESNLRFEMAAPSSTRPTSPVRPSLFMPSPPGSASDENRDRSIPDGPLEQWETAPPLSSDFAPARAAREALDSNTTAISGHHNSRDGQGLETPPPESWESSSYPPLRRVRHMSPRPLPRVDGLGDRRRSPSPSMDPQEEETWTNLLSTMENGSSSATTSFTSISDLASHSGRNSQNTSTSFGEIGSAEDTCDLDLPPGITESDVMEVRARHGRLHESRARGGAVMSTGRGARRDLPDEAEARRVELGLFHAILDRMQRREEVPDDWWALVGLPPDFGRTNLDPSS